MTAGRSCAAAWRISRWWCGLITSRAFRKCRPPFITSSGKQLRNLPVGKIELYGTERCPYTSEMRDWLEFRRCEFVEYDVEADPEAMARMQSLAGAQRSVPVLVEDGRVVQIGWQGRSCIVGGPSHE